MALSTTVNYASGTNFTYNTANTQFSNNTVQLLDQRPSGLTFGATFTTSINADWGAGSLTGTATSGASIISSQLDCSSGKGLWFSAASNFINTQSGAIRVQYYPNYSGAPGATPVIFEINAHGVGSADRITLYQDASGVMTGLFRDTSGTLTTVAFGSISFVAGTQYEIELNYDFTGGATRLFINGVQVGTTSTATLTRGTTPTRIALGAAGDVFAVSSASYTGLEIFSSVQHTANYTSGYTLTPTIYVTTNPVVTLNSGFQASSISAFTAVTTVSGSDAVQYNVIVDGSYWYWTGSAWALSNGLYAQSNTASAINTNIGTLPLTGNTIKIAAFLHSATGATTPSITSVTITYNYLANNPTSPSSCLVYGWVLNPSGVGINLATVKATMVTPYFYQQFLIPAYQVSTTTDANGYWSLQLVETTSVTKSVVFDIEYSDGVSGKRKESYTATIPNSLSQTFSAIAQAS